MCQQCGADASGPPSACEPGAPRSQALVLELSCLSRGQAQREESLRSARVALAQLKLVATPPDGPRRVGAKIVNSISCGLRRSQFDAQDLPALLLTYRSSTLSERQIEDPHTSDNSMLLSARELIDKFYSLLGQRVAKSKRNKSLDECLSLLQEGFTVEEIDYTITWLITHHPTTGSFSRLPHFIDQALKARDLQHHTPQHYAPSTRESKDDQLRRQQEQDEAQQQERIEAAKASLSPSALAAFREEAERCVDQEHPNIKFGRDTLVRLKLEDLLIKQYLSQPSEPC